MTHYLARAPDAATKLSISAALSRLGGLGFQAQSTAKATAGLVEGMDEQVGAMGGGAVRGREIRAIQGRRGEQVGKGDWRVKAMDEG